LKHSYILDPLGRKRYCYFCPKKTILRPQKEEKSAGFSFQTRFQLNQSDLIEISKRNEPKKERFRGKQTK
jgi:hypothetical protein